MSGPEVAAALRGIVNDQDPDRYGLGVKVRLPYSQEGRAALQDQLLRLAGELDGATGLDPTGASSGADHWGGV